MRSPRHVETNVFLARAIQAHRTYACRHRGTPKDVDGGSCIEEHGDGQFFAVLRFRGIVLAVYAITEEGTVKRTGDYPETIT